MWKISSPDPVEEPLKNTGHFQTVLEISLYHPFQKYPVVNNYHNMSIGKQFVMNSKSDGYYQIKLNNLKLLKNIINNNPSN